MQGSELKKLRESRGWTQQQLADHFGCSVRRIKGIEAGEHKLSRSELRDMRLLEAGADLEPAVAR